MNANAVEHETQRTAASKALDMVMKLCAISGDRLLGEDSGNWRSEIFEHGRAYPNSVSQSVSQSVNSQSHPALTPPPALRPAPLLPFKHKYRVFAPGGYSIVASEVRIQKRSRTKMACPEFSVCG